MITNGTLPGSALTIKFGHDHQNKSTVFAVRHAGKSMFLRKVLLLLSGSNRRQAMRRWVVLLSGLPWGLRLQSRRI